MRGAALAFLLASPASAWGPLGHRTVALLAEERLTPAAKARVAELLGGVSLDDVAACADEVRGGSFKCAGSIPMKKGETMDWHFINVPIGASVSAGTLMDHCRAPRRKESSCVVEQIRRHREVLADKERPSDVRRLALVWLVHLVGDLHQPLHASTEYQDKRYHDLGGNKKEVFLLDAGGAEPVSLHRLWDGLMRTDPDERGPGARATAARLSKELQGVDTTAWVAGDYVAQAALESFELADTVIYPQYRKDGGKVGRAYRDRMRPLANDRLKKAGVRLAHLLSEALD